MNILEFFGQPLFVNLVIGGLTVATACITYFARQIIKNQTDVLEVKTKVDAMLKDLSKVKEEYKASRAKLEHHIEDQQDDHQKVIAELSRVAAIIDLVAKPYDGVDRRIK